MLARCLTRQWAGLTLGERLYVSAAWDRGDVRWARFDVEMQRSTVPVWSAVVGPVALALMSVKDG